MNAGRDGRIRGVSAVTRALASNCSAIRLALAAALAVSAALSPAVAGAGAGAWPSASAGANIKATDRAAAVVTIAIRHEFFTEVRHCAFVRHDDLGGHGAAALSLAAGVSTIKAQGRLC